MRLLLVLVSHVPSATRLHTCLCQTLLAKFEVEETPFALKITSGAGFAPVPFCLTSMMAPLLSVHSHVGKLAFQCWYFWKKLIHFSRLFLHCRNSAVLGVIFPNFSASLRVFRGIPRSRWRYYFSLYLAFFPATKFVEPFRIYQVLQGISIFARVEWASYHQIPVE